jgi:hypothetical protein
MSSLRVALAFCLASGATLAGEPAFEDVTIASGIDPVHYANPADFSAGSAVLDWDLDGWPDLLVAQSMAPLALWRSTGPPDFLFEDVSMEAGLAEALYDSCCVQAADFTGDGIVDLLLMSDGTSGSLRLLTGRPDGVFVDESLYRLVAPRSKYIATSAVDMDGDGDLDLVATRWAFLSPARAADCLATHFFENRGGVLEYVTKGAPAAVGCGLLGSLTDVDQDGDLDYFQANDFGPFFVANEVFLNEGLDNEGNWLFGPDVAAELGLHGPVYGMGIAVGDINRDLIMDYFVTSLGEDVLLMGQPGGGYEDGTATWRAGSTLGLSKRRFKWGASMMDVDNDGWEELLVTAGGLFDYLEVAQGPAMSILLRNTGSAPLQEFSSAGGLASKSVDRSFAWGDFDRDGRIDVVVNAIEQTQMLRNVSTESGHWLGIRLQGSVANQSGLGSRVTVACGGEAWLRELQAGGNPGSTDEPILHVGLGACAGPATVTVRWPSGRSQTIVDVAIDTIADVTEPSWLTLSESTALADGATTITVRYLHDEPGSAAVTWNATGGVQDSSAMNPVGDGWYEGVLTAPAAPQEVAIVVQVDGVALPAHPTIRFRGVESVAWGQWPAPAYRGRLCQLGVTLTGKDGTAPGGAIGFTVTGGTVVNGSIQVGPSTGMALVSILPESDATEVVLQTTLAGVPFGPKRLVTLHQTHTAAHSRLVIRPTVISSPEEPIHIVASLLDAQGWFAPSNTDPDAPNPYKGTLYRDGEVALGPSSFSAGGPFGLSAGLLVATVPASTLGGAGTYTLSVNGILFDEKAHLVEASEGSPLSLMNEEQSLLRFMDRHVYGDGEDIVPITLFLRDGFGQSVPIADLSSLALDCVGCTWIPEKTVLLKSDNHTDQFMMYVQVGEGLDEARVTLVLDGVPTGLKAAVPMRDPAPYAPTAENTLFVVFVLTDPPAPAVQVPADGVTELLARIIPKDTSKNLVGSGQGIELHCDCGPTHVAYEGFGLYAGTFTAPATPCTATLTLTMETMATPQTHSIAFVDGAGEVVETPCLEVIPQPLPLPEPPPEATPEPQPEAAPEPQMEPQPEPQPEQRPDPDPALEPERNPESDPVPDPGLSPDTTHTTGGGCGCRVGIGPGTRPVAPPTSWFVVIGLYWFWRRTFRSGHGVGP